MLSDMSQCAGTRTFNGSDLGVNTLPAAALVEGESRPWETELHETTFARSGESHARRVERGERTALWWR